MTDKIYHIYDEETCIAPCVSEEAFHKHWEKEIKDHPDKLDYEEFDDLLDKDMSEGSY
jgi:poly-D-alanine transfer protein DltD